MNIHITEIWRERFPNAHIGMLLISNIDNTKRPTSLDQRKKEVEALAQAKYANHSRADLLQIDILDAYKNYYKKFGNTYHVQLQLESIAFKGKTLPSVTPLVDANFIAEIDTLLLSAGHDADLLEGTVTIDVTDGTEPFTQMNGKSRTLKAHDMMMRDEQDIVCTILYGQDQRTPISPSTTRALYVTYAPEGITQEQVEGHLEAIKENVLLFVPEADVEYLEIHSA